MQKHPTNDESYRFLFEEADIRGETVILDNVLEPQCYTPLRAWREADGWFVAATVVISNNLKFNGLWSCKQE